MSFGAMVFSSIRSGDFVKKPMSACTGREIMTEIMGHLRIETDARQDT